MNRGTLATAALLALSLITAAAAQTQYQVTVNTSSLKGTTGQVDFQFNPAMTPVAIYTDTISGFTSTGTLSGTPTTTGSATGSLPGPVTLTNNSPYNDYYQTFTFGNSLTFLTTFSGRTANKSSDSDTFAFSLYDSTGTAALLTNDPNGSVAEIMINPNGSFSTQVNPNSDGSASVASITRINAPAVPEPSSLVTFSMAGTGLLGLMAVARKRKAASKVA